MSDSAIASLVTGLITITTLIVGWASLWVKLRYGANMAETAATKAEAAVTKAATVEAKIDANTAATHEVNAKADTIVKQTNGTVSEILSLVSTLKERVGKLEDYNRDSAHRLIDAVNAVHVKVAELVAMQPKAVPPLEVRTPGDTP